MKKLLFLMLLAPFAAYGQKPTPVTDSQRTEAVRFISATTGSDCYDIRSLGINYHKITWRTTEGTVSGGTIKLVGSSAADCTSPSDIITAQDWTTNGTATATSSGASYVKLVPASFAGSGSMMVTYQGFFANPDAGVTALGALTDNKSTATDTTSTSMISLLKEISFKMQAIADGTATASVSDPCWGVTATTVPISIAADTVVISAASSKKTYICSLTLAANSTSEIINVVEGTGSVCATSKAALVGSTTDANGVTLAATGGGFVSPKTIFGIGTNVDTCITLSGTNRVAGWLTYIQQ